MAVTIIKRNEEFNVKAGMTLWDTLKKIEVLQAKMEGLFTQEGNPDI